MKINANFTQTTFARFWFRSGLLMSAAATLLTGSLLKAQADERAEMLLQQVHNTLSQAQSVSAEFTTQSLYGSRFRDTQEKGTVTLERPGLGRIEIARFRKPENADTWKETGNGSTVVADGSQVWTLIRHPQNVQYRSTAASALTQNQLLDNLEPLRGFFSGVELPRNKAIYVGSKQWENAAYEVVRVEISPQKRGIRAVGTQENRPSELKPEAELYIGTDGFIHRYVVTGLENNPSGRREIALRHIQKDASFPASTFTLTLPKDAVPYERAPAGATLTPGTLAPDFTIEDAAGKPLRLSDFRGKIVVLKFWATWCCTCKLSLPATNDLARRYANKDVIVLAVDIWDSRKALQTWLSHKPGVDNIRFGIDPQPQGKDIASTLYHVKATPTQVVIDKEGKITAVVEGYDGPDDTLEAAIHSAQKPLAAAEESRKEDR